MRIAIAFSMVVAVAVSATPCSAVLVGYWNFNDLDIPGTGSTNVPGDGNVPLTIPADAGSGTISLADWGGGVQDFAGSTTNALFDDPAGASLSLQRGSGDLDGNNTFIEVQFSMAGLRDLDISYWTRKTGTGFDANQWSYSTDGVSFFDFGQVIDPIDDADGELIVLPTLPALDGVANAFLRYTLSGATTAAGNNRIDNLVLTAVPEASAFLLGGLVCGLIGIVYAGRTFLSRRGRADHADELVAT